MTEKRREEILQEGEEKQREEEGCVLALGASLPPAQECLCVPQSTCLQRMLIVCVLVCTIFALHTPPAQEACYVPGVVAGVASLLHNASIGNHNCCFLATTAKY